MQTKFDMVIQGAYTANAEALLVSDEGCLEAGHSPAVLGKAFGLALKTSAHRPAELLLTGSSEFVVAVRHAAGLTDDSAPSPSARPATYRSDSAREKDPEVTNITAKRPMSAGAACKSVEKPRPMSAGASVRPTHESQL